MPPSARAGGPLVIRVGEGAKNKSDGPVRMPPKLAAAMRVFGFRFGPKPQRSSDFTLRDSGGNFYQPGDSRGTWLLLNFFATWCGPCMREMPSLQALSRAGPCLKVVGVATGHSEQPSKVAAQGIDFPLLWDSDNAVGDSWGVRGFPTTFLVDPHGYVHAVAVGGRPWEQMADAVFMLPACDARRHR